MAYLIGVDIGTSGTKTVLFDEAGAVVASALCEYPLYQPKNGWAEQDPEDWWQATVTTIHTVLQKSGILPGQIAGIGLSGQMHGLVMLDGEGNVLRPAILWCDGRTVTECEEITQLVGQERLIAQTANPALPGFTASKILWVRKHEPECYAKCRQILLPKDYVRYRLTGVYATEVSDASGMNLMDIPHRSWSNEVLHALKIDLSLLPPLYESPEIVGHITEQAATLTGLTAGTPVAGGAGDNAAAAVGTGVVQEGRAFTTLGTSGVIFAHSDQVAIDPKGRVHSFCAAVPGGWSVMSCTLSAGGSLQWLRNQLFRAEMETAAQMNVDPYVLMDQQAAQSPIGANRLLFLPYLMGERSPLLDSEARGVFFGLSAIHQKRDLLRAVLEGVTYSQRQCLDILREMGITFTEMLACGGGGASLFWRQMLADVYGCPVSVSASRESGALGVAILAGVGVGLYSSVQAACSKLIRTKSAVSPDLKNSACYEPFYQLYRQLYPALQGQFHTLAQL